MKNPKMSEWKGKLEMNQLGALGCAAGCSLYSQLHSWLELTQQDNKRESTSHQLSSGSLWGPPSHLGDFPDGDLEASET